TAEGEESGKKLGGGIGFHTVVGIAREEGILGLYQGLNRKIFKGIFSHGLTMLMKGGIYVAVMRLYYLILKALKRYPSPEELARLAKERVNEAVYAMQSTVARLISSIASGKRRCQSLSGSLEWIRSDRRVSITVLFVRSAWPFCSGEYGAVV